MTTGATEAEAGSAVAAAAGTEAEATGVDRVEATGIQTGKGASALVGSIRLGSSPAGATPPTSATSARVCPGNSGSAGLATCANTAAKSGPRASFSGPSSPPALGSPGLAGALGCKTDKTSSVMCVTGRPVVRITASASVPQLSKKHDRQNLAAWSRGVESGGTGIAWRSRNRARRTDTQTQRP